MNYTPFANLSDDEFIRHICNKSNPTDEELEAMERLTYWKEYAETLAEELERPLLTQTDTRTQTKYKEVA